MKTKKKCKALVYDAVQSFKKIGLGWNMQSEDQTHKLSLKTDNALPILQGLTIGDTRVKFYLRLNIWISKKKV